MSDLRERVVDWMRTHRKGYRAAASHFEVSVDQVKYWSRVARRLGDLETLAETPPPTHAVAAPPRVGLPMASRLEPTEVTDEDLAVIGSIAFYESMVRRLAAQVALAEDRSATNSLASLMKQLQAAREALDAARERKAAEDQAGKGVSPAEAAERLLVMVERLPRPFLERLYQRVLEVMGGPPLRLVDDEQEVEAS